MVNHIILNIFSIVNILTNVIMWENPEGELLYMISYEPFYNTLLKRDLTEYALIFKYGISANTLHRMKHGKPITTTTLDALCGILECHIEDIIQYKQDV